MEWPVFQAGAPAQPVFFNAVRPGRGRPRLNSDHPNRPVYMQDGNGMLVPAAPVGGEPMYRSNSNRERPTSVVIHNTHWDDHSPSRDSHRRGSHGHEYCYHDDWSDQGYAPGRHYSHSHHGRSPSRSPSPRYDPQLAERLKKLEELEKAEEEKQRAKAAEERKKIQEIEAKEKEKKARERFLEEEMLAAQKKRQKEKDEKKQREAWIEEWKTEEQQKKRKEEEKKEKENAEWREKTVANLAAAGLSNAAIEKILRKTERSEKKQELLKEKGHAGGGDEGKQLMRPTYIKVHRKYMSTDTLDVYGLPWELDTDTDYIIIKRWINEHDQQELFQHTAKLRDKKQRKKIEDTALELRKEKGRLMLVGKKREGQRSRSRSRGLLVL